MVNAQCFLYNNIFEGEPKESDFKLIEGELPALNNGEVQLEALFWSVDPYMRVYPQRYGLQTGSVMTGGQIARVISSKDPKYEIGDVVYGEFGWRTHTNVNMSDKTNFFPSYKLHGLNGLSFSHGLGAVGMSGNAAYFGFLELCKPQAGETVVVSGAAGAVGNLVGQIAKLKGCKVIGITGTPEKCKWLKEELSFDYAINYKTENIEKTLQSIAPNGIDCYFDNVGGEISSTVISQMNIFGRISVCGSVSCYNANLQHFPVAPLIQRDVVRKQLRMEGFIVSRWREQWQEGMKQMSTWISEGKIKAPEWVVSGFENIPKAFIAMLRGENIGKTVIKA